MPSWISATHSSRAAASHRGGDDVLPLLTLPQTSAVFAVTVAAGGAALASLQAGQGRVWLARGSLALATTTGLGLLLWALGSPSLAARGVWMSWASLMVLAPFVLGLLGGAALARAARVPAGVPASPGRRAFLQAGVVALPASTAGASVAGFSSANAPQRIPLVPMRYPGLHPDLEGLRILHLSDLHLGAAMHASDLEALLERAAALHPDLVVLTGDVADDLRELEQALEVVHRHRPRLGVFASLGNHEYLHGIDVTRAVYERSPVPLLVDRGVTLPVGEAQLYLAGVDDPFGKGDHAAFFEGAVERCATGAPPDAFRVLLSHRPRGFFAAAARGFHLTLSGHTHGGQVGLFGVSALQPILRGEPLWGAYERNGRRLYTTSGFGHWFPFRLGCPTEAPLIVLSR
jgi:predicted MPP superfamily phosphohydrolase